MVEDMEGGVPKYKETWIYRYGLQLLVGYLLIFMIVLGLAAWIWSVDPLVLGGILGSGIFGYGCLVKVIWDDLHK